MKICVARTQGSCPTYAGKRNDVGIVGLAKARRDYTRFLYTDFSVWYQDCPASSMQLQEITPYCPDSG